MRQEFVLQQKLAVEKQVQTQQHPGWPLDLDNADLNDLDRSFVLEAAELMPSFISDATFVDEDEAIAPFLSQATE